MKATQFNTSKLLGYRIAFQSDAIAGKLGANGSSKLGAKVGDKRGFKGGGKPN